MEAKFMWNGIKVDGELYRAFYSCGSYSRSGELIDKTITIYAKDYKSFPQIDGLQIVNETDIMTDYFETDRIRVQPTNKHYAAVKAAYEKQKAHDDKRFEKRYGKRTA